MAEQKNQKRQILGAQAKAKGKHFESILDKSFAYYAATGFASIEKTPEPMRPTKSLGNGKFIAFYERQAQPDYKGTVKGGRAVMFEAKFTDKDRIQQDAVKEHQGAYMTKHQALGARCYVVVGFSSGAVFKVPWPDWANMKELFGRKYAKESELEKYRVQTSWNGVLLLLN